jgi:surfactin synthase thioesterase subunit
MLHHGIVIRREKDKRQGKLPDMPPVTFFGHDFGSTVAFELIRLLKKSKTVYLPVHHFIVSACRPPEVCVCVCAERGVVAPCPSDELTNSLPPPDPHTGTHII